MSKESFAYNNKWKHLLKNMFNWRHKIGVGDIPNTFTQYCILSAKCMQLDTIKF